MAEWMVNMWPLYTEQLMPGYSERVRPWRYNLGGGGITVSPFTCQVKSTFKENSALTPNVPPYFNQSSTRIDDHVVQLQLKIVNIYTWLALS